MKFKKLSILTLSLVISAFFLFPTNNVDAHCDSIDGPVVAAAKKALETGNLNYVLPYVYKGGETEVIAAFNKVRSIQTNNPEIRETLNYWFYETVVRVHREGEGATYTGLQPAGIDYGPALHAAEEAITTESAEELKALILKTIAEEIDNKFTEVMEKQGSLDNVDETRERVEAELMFQKYIDTLYRDAISQLGHGEGHSEGDSHEAEAGHNLATETEHNTDAEFKILIEGKELKSDVQATLVNGKVYVPLRSVFEAVGATVDWNQTSHLVSAELEDKSISFKLGEATAVLNGKKIGLEDKPIVIDGRTLIPVEMIEHVLGLHVEIELEHHTIKISH